MSNYNSYGYTLSNPTYGSNYITYNTITQNSYYPYEVDRPDEIAYNAYREARQHPAAMRMLFNMLRNDLVLANELTLTTIYSVTVGDGEDKVVQLKKKKRSAFCVATAVYPNKRVVIEEISFDSGTPLNLYSYTPRSNCDLCNRHFNDGSFDGNRYVLQAKGDLKIYSSVVCQLCYESRMK